MATDDQSGLDDHALDIDPTAATRFQMQSFQSSTGQWRPMEQGSGGHVWRPRSTAVDAAAKCLAWTGFTGIPAMQVVNLRTREVVWRLSDHYPQAGESIRLRAVDERRAHEQARTDITENARPPDNADRPVQPSLFELPQ